MRKRLLYLVLLLTVLILPFTVSAKEISVAGKTYQVKDYLETLQDEGITPTVPDYTGSTEKINIYLFYGKGCEHCTNFLNFLNEISPEYSQYFNVISFEIYGSKDNSRFLKTLAGLIGVKSEGVPFVFIGDKYWNGYSEEMNDDMKAAITELYNTEYNKRTDIMRSYEKETGYTGTKKGLSDGMKIVLLDLLFTTIGTVIVIIFVNYKINSLNIKKKKQDK